MTMLMVGRQKQMTSVADDVSGCGSRAERSEMACNFITLLRMAHNLKLTNCLFLESSV